MIVENPSMYNIEDKILMEFEDSGIIDLFNEELNLVLEVLGYDFLDDANTVMVEKNVLNSIEDKLSYILQEIDDDMKEKVFEVLNDVKRIQLASFYQLIESYANETMYLSKKHNKKINPVKLHCPRDIMVPVSFKELTKSLIHIFINSIDHGIEYSKDRINNGKPELGTISCNISMTSNVLTIEISDDGKGIDPDSLSQYLITNKLKTEDELSSLFEDEILALIFEDGVSTKETNSEITRHGVGMGTIKQFVDELDGSINVDSIYGKGTTITICVPVSFEEDLDLETSDNITVMNSALVQCANFVEGTTDIEFYTNKDVEDFEIRDKNCFINLRGDFEGQIAFSFDESIINSVAEVMFEGFDETEINTLKEDLVNEIVNTVVGLAIQSFPESRINTAISIPYSFDQEMIEQDILNSSTYIIKNIITSVGKISCILIEK
jgi:CheY-specific phosphatase CheX/two-component sensor histidine kinase